MNCVYLLTQASSSQRNTQLLLWQMSPPKHLPCHVCPWQTWHVDRDSSMGTMDLATFPLFSGSTIGFLQKGSVFVSVCATLKKPWREDWNIWRGDDLMGRELLFQRLEDVCQLFLSSQSSSITIVPSSNARDSKLFQQDWLFIFVTGLQ